MSSDDIHALAGAYALDALDELERERFEAHLSRCSSCQEEVDGFRGTAARLAALSSSAPPPALRDSVLSAAATVRQEPPAVRALSARRRRLAPLLAAAAAVVLVVAGVLTVTAIRDRDSAEDMASVLTAADAERMTLAPTQEGPSGATGAVVWSASHGAAVVTLDGLPQLDEGRAYALWFIVDGTPHPMALVTDSDADGHAVMMFDAPAEEGVEAMGVTDEPASGSEAPTTPILLATTA